MSDVRRQYPTRGRDRLDTCGIFCDGFLVFDGWGEVFGYSCGGGQTVMEALQLTFQQEK